VVSSVNPSVWAQSVTFTATVSPLGATGTVQFLDGSTVLGVVGVASGTASLMTSSLAPGAHPITSVYSGDANYGASSSAALSQTVNKAPTTTTLTSSQNPAKRSTAVTL